MEYLWAPWRMEYIKAPREQNCIFCTKPAEKDRFEENLILHVARLSFVMLNRYPYQNGHLMVVPLRHTSDFADLDKEELAEIAWLLQESVRALKTIYNAEGINLGMNIGRCAGAGIEEHVHFHVVPRWSGDTSFLSALAGTKPMPELLTDTYARLRPWFQAIEERAAKPDSGGPRP